jgi:flagellar hook-associated protein 1 FlgK
MSNLLASLRASGDALAVFQQALGTVQNNISNSSTPGYAKQQLNLEAQPFDLAGGLAGGVAARGLDDSRNEFAEEEVRQQVSTLGRFQAQSQAAGGIEKLFDVSGTTGLPAALNQLFTSFSAWSVNTSSTSARQSVLDSAGQFADQVRGLAKSLNSVSQSQDQQISSTVEQINGLTTRIQQYNVERRKLTQPDPGLDAQANSALEQLSQLTDFTAVKQDDGTITVLAGGGSPLVIGENQYLISAGVAVGGTPPNSQAPPTARILDWQGGDITAQITSGTLGGLLDVRNRVLPSIVGDAQQPGSLNRLAQGLADTVNQILQSGTVSSDAGAAQGSALFVYDSSDPTAAAGSLRLNSNLTTAQLAPVDSAGNANGNAILLASLSDATATTGKIDGLGPVAFLSQIAAFIGKESSAATDGQQSQQQVAAQARTLRDQVSGVSLDEQAISLIDFQRSYQATARVLTTLSDLLQTTIDMIR